ncbi:MAG: lysyl-tRNA synthetase, class [Solirubrobacterales bacterium]|jgi:lysyl-tRNA synthetase class 2|nr:lysyl-tRNA synthetase, class [Solirubrobacterales bacterium]
MSDAPPQAGETPPEATGDRSGAASEAQRRSKVERLRDAGINPYPHSFEGRTHAKEILDAHDPAELGEGEHDEFSYRVMGRVTGKRGHGKTVFFDVRDITGTIQGYARRDALGEEAFERIEDLDIGDLVGIEGPLYVTKRGELAISVRECTLLAKALKDPPDLFHGISDPEMRYRQRELDLMANEESREVFKTRAKLLWEIRNFMNGHGWVELETPILQRLTGGAAARPFVTHHNALDRELFLRTATELYLKRAIVGGFEDVYEFGKFFRNEGMSPQHNPEFTMLEMFVGGADYNGVMNFVEVLVATVVEQVLGTTKVMRDGVEIDFAAPWPRVVLRDELLKETGVDIYKASRDELAELAGDDAEETDDWAGLVDTLQGKLIEPKLIQPTFITVLPIDIWPLVKVHPDDPKVCEAFDGIVAGMEIVGGGTDINDPVEQRERFIGQRERQESGAEEDPHPHDEEFVRAIEYGMPPASGCGLGIDRLLMIMTESKTLRDVIIYPAMREQTGD